MKSFLALLLVVLAISTVDASKRATNIVGGTNATAGQFPFMVKLTVGDGMGSAGRCGGFIIDATHVGTAAHCFEANTSAANVQAQAGTIDVSGSAGQIRTASSFVIHPLYNTTSFLYDAAIITLSEPLVLDGVNTKAITLATGLPTAGSSTYGAGWGTTSSGGSTVDYLLWVNLPYQTIATCDAVYNPLTPNVQICAGGVAGFDTCQGDSGGPLFTATDPANPTDATVIGIVSFGNGCGTNPGVYADVPGFAKAFFEGIIAQSTSGVPSSGAVAASSGVVAASSGAVAASSGAVAASSGEVAASSGAVAASSGAVAASSGVVAASSGVVAASSGVVAASSGVVAASSGVVAASSGVVAASSGVVAASSGVVAASSSGVVAASSSGVVAASSVVVAASSSGVVAASSGVVAASSGIVAASSGVVAASSGVVAASSGVVAASSGVVAATTVSPSKAVSAQTVTGLAAILCRDACTLTFRQCKRGSRRLRVCRRAKRACVGGCGIINPV